MPIDASSALTPDNPVAAAADQAAKHVPDHIDHLLASWHTTLPGRDFADMALVTRLLRITTLLIKRIMPVIERAGLNQGEFDVLATLYRNGGKLSPTTLYQRLLITSGAMSNRLDTLAQKGLIQRLANPADKRSMEVIISNEGRQLFEPLLEMYLQQLALTLPPADQRDALNQGLRQLLLHLDAQPDAEPAPKEVNI